MARRSSYTDNMDLPGLFTPEELGERPIVNAEAPSASDKANANNEPIYFMSFGSGSSGNCSYIGDRRSGFLIDAGVDAKKVEDTLLTHGISMDKVKGILITHDHGDHVRYVYSLLRNHRHLLVYCTPKALNGMLRRHSLSRRVKDYHRAIYKEFEFKIGNFVITPFEVLHDGTDNCGFYITNGSSSIGVATDLGCISPRVDHYMSQANFLMIESNYDLQMLRNGRYPDYLKARIEQENGHLDNNVSAQFVASRLRPELTHVFLCHLSHDNNTPELALEAHRCAYREANREIRIGDGTQENLTDIQLIALPRFDATPLYVLRLR